MNHPIADPDLQEFYDRAESDHDSDQFHACGPRPTRARATPAPEQGVRADRLRAVAPPAVGGGGAEPSPSLDAPPHPLGVSTDPGPDAHSSPASAPGQQRVSGLHPGRAALSHPDAGRLPAGVGGEFYSLMSQAHDLLERAVACCPVVPLVTEHSVAGLPRRVRMAAAEVKREVGR